jgi:formylglycine-generating enzyme required for sulfatase activity
VVAPGAFLMGATEAETANVGRSETQNVWERPQHRVVVSTPLAIGRFDVTRGDYARFLAATGYSVPAGCMVDNDGVWGFDAGRSFRDPGYPVDDRHPANCVSWDDAKAYAAWLSRATGHPYRLLHEAEWEYAARAGTTGDHWWGPQHEDLCAYLNGADRSYDRAFPGYAFLDRACDDGYAETSPSGAFRPNPFGLYDMYGDVEQWTGDCFAPSYANARRDAEAEVGTTTCETVAVRGGTWHSGWPLFRASSRGFLPYTMRATSVGFRIVRLPDAARQLM